jgi:hypothetical protein
MSYSEGLYTEPVKTGCYDCELPVNKQEKLF